MNTLIPSLLAASAGGAIGAALRVLFLQVALPAPWGILALNIMGALVLGFVLSSLGERAPLLTLFLGAGVLGALTTFSSFAGDAVRLAGETPAIAGLYVVGSVVLAIAAFAGGQALGGRIG